MFRLRCLVALCALVAVPALAGPSPARATTYYVAASGSDADAGTSPDAPLASLAAASGLDLQPGDRLLLRGGDTFAGPLTLGPQDGGDPGAPVVVGSYGAGRATVAGPGSGDGVLVHDAGHVLLQDLRVRGTGPLAGGAHGVEVRNDSGAELAGIAMSRLEVSGFHGWGVWIDGYGDGSGLRDVTLSDLDVHDNGAGGISTWTDPPDFSDAWPDVPVLRDVEVAGSAVHDNRGYPGIAEGPTGNGVVLSHVVGGRIHDSVAYGNGGLDDNPDLGPCAFIVYESAQVRVDHDEAYDNHTGSPHDGCGFDLDDRVSGSVLEDDYAHGNDGAGFLWSNVSGAPSSGDAIRRDVSIGDGRHGDQAAILVFRRADGLLIEHDTVIAPDATDHGEPAALALRALPDAGAGPPVLVRDDVLAGAGGAPLLTSTTQAPGVVLQGNAWHATTGPARFALGDRLFTGLAELRSATGQETAAGGPTGLEADPLLVGGEGAGAIRPLPGSPLRDAGVDTGALGGTDFFGEAAVAGAGEDIGAAEVQVADLSVAAAMTGPASFDVVVANAGPGRAVAAALTLTPPPGAAVEAGALPAPWSCAPAASDGSVRCAAAGPLPAGASRLPLAVTPATAPVAVQVSVGDALSIDPTAADDAATVTLPGAGPPASVVVLDVRRHQRAGRVRRRLRVGVACAGATACRGRLVVRRALGDGRSRVLGTARYAVPAGRRRTVVVPLRGAVRRPVVVSVAAIPAARAVPGPPPVRARLLPAA